MSQPHKSITWVLVSFTFFTSLFLAACSSSQNGAAFANFDPINQDIDQTLEAAFGFIFAGKVTDPSTQKWQNDYLAIVFLDGVEIGRHVSTLGKFENSGAGVHNGLFKITFPNTYELTAETLFIRSDGDFMKVGTNYNVYGKADYLYTWFGEIAPGSVIRIQVPAKQIEYAIVIMEKPVSELAEGLLVTGQAQLTDTNQVETAVIDNQVGTGDLEPSETISSNKSIESDMLKKEVRWTRTLSDFSGNRHDVWKQFVEPTVPELTWNEFKELVLLYNPELVPDGNLFYTNKLYVIPELN